MAPAVCLRVDVDVLSFMAVDDAFFPNVCESEPAERVAGECGR